MGAVNQWRLEQDERELYRALIGRHIQLPKRASKCKCPQSAYYVSTVRELLEPNGCTLFALSLDCWNCHHTLTLSPKTSSIIAEQIREADDARLTFYTDD